MLEGEAKQLPSSSDVRPVPRRHAILASEIILPITPAVEFTDAVSTGLSLNWFAVITCRLPNNAFAEVSLRSGRRRAIPEWH